MKIQLSEHFTYKKLLRFTLPSVVMMIFTSIYGVVDGLFVSNFVGKTPFAAVNLIMPFLMSLGTLGFMIGTGGSALVAKTLGEGDRTLANRYFSMLVYITAGSGILLAAISMFCIRPVAELLGAEGEMTEYCVLYGRIILITLPAFMLQNVFQSFFATAEKPKLGLSITVAAGVTNMVLDALFVAVFHWGIAGAAAATAISQAVGGFVPLLYFARKNTSLLRLTKTEFYGKAFLKTCTNGSSELMTNLSTSVVSMLYNYRLMQLAGENGVAAYGVIMYINMIFLAVFLGYSIGSAPIISYHYGAQNHAELRNMFRKSLVLLSVSGIAMLLLSETLAGPLAKIFVGYDAELFELTCHAFRLYAVSFLLAGFNIFGSAFFTALGNGAVSATISFLRTLLFQVAAVLILPAILGMNGIWLAMVAAEALACLVTFAFFAARKKKYQYA